MATMRTVHIRKPGGHQDQVRLMPAGQQAGLPARVPPPPAHDASGPSPRLRRVPHRGAKGNAVALWACGLGSRDEDGLCAGAGGLWPGMVFGPFELVVGHLAFDDAGLAAQASGGQESFQEVLLEHHQGSDQEVRGKSCPA